MRRRLPGRLEPTLAFNQSTSLLSRSHRRTKLVVSIVAFTAPILRPAGLLSVTKRKDQVGRVADELQQRNEQLNSQFQHIPHRTSFPQSVWIKRRRIVAVCVPDRIHRRRGSLREGVLPDDADEEEVVPEARHCRERGDADSACRKRGDNGIENYPVNIVDCDGSVKSALPVAPAPGSRRDPARRPRHAPGGVLPPPTEPMYIAWRSRSRVLTGKPRQARRPLGRLPSRGSSSNDRARTGGLLPSVAGAIRHRFKSPAGRHAPRCRSSDLRPVEISWQNIAQPC